MKFWQNFVKLISSIQNFIKFLSIFSQIFLQLFLLFLKNFIKLYPNYPKFLPKFIKSLQKFPVFTENYFYYKMFPIFRCFGDIFFFHYFHWFSPKWSLILIISDELLCFTRFWNITYALLQLYINFSSDIDFGNTLRYVTKKTIIFFCPSNARVRKLFHVSKFCIMVKMVLPIRTLKSNRLFLFVNGGKKLNFIKVCTFVVVDVVIILVDGSFPDNRFRFLGLGSWVYCLAPPCYYSSGGSFSNLAPLLRSSMQFNLASFICRFYSDSGLGFSSHLL